MLDYDDTSGVGSMSLLQGSTSTRYVLVGCGRYSPSPGNLHLVSNSTFTDADGDGVGVELELELTSCDSASTFPRCIDVFNRADSDRDGITDYAEIFGVDGASPLRLHRWGARPGVKDIFVEVDWSKQSATNPNGFVDNPLAVHSTPGQIETFARAVQDYYTESGVSNWLGNISTSHRVRIHLDLGIDPPAGSPDVWLYGNWGGSSACPTRDPVIAYNTCLTASRQGFFRVALANTGGGGQSSPPSSRLWWGTGSDAGVDLRSIVFAHELGHAIGLRHWGSNFYGGEPENCSPLYVSIMNYCYQYNNNVRFSSGTYTGIGLNPARISEWWFPGTLPARLQDSPWTNLDLSGTTAADWNRDNAPASSNVRAPISFNESADQALANEQRTVDLLELNVVSTPALTIGYANHHYIFFVRNGQIRYRAPPHLGLAAGGCPGGGLQGENDPKCTTFASPSSGVVGETGYGQTVVDVSATWWAGRIMLAYTVNTGQLYTMEATGSNSNGIISGWTPRVLIADDVVGRPSISVWNVDSAVYGANQVAGILYGEDVLNAYAYSTRSSVAASWTAPLYAVTLDNTLLGVGPGVAATPWPSVTPPIGVLGTACAVFTVGSPGGWTTGQAAQARLYCLERGDALQRWRRMAAGFDALTFTPPGLAYHVSRLSNGTPITNQQRGAFWISFQQEATAAPRVAIVGADAGNTDPTLSGAWRIETSGWWGNSSSTALAGTGVELRSDLGVGAMKGAWVATAGVLGLRFEPLADGSFDGELCDGNDWMMMNRAMCVGLRDSLWGDSNTFCGTSSGYESINFGNEFRDTCARK